MFEIIDTKAPFLYNVVQLSKTMGYTGIADLGEVNRFISAWVQAFHNKNLEWWDIGPGSSRQLFSKTETWR